MKTAKQTPSLTRAAITDGSEDVFTTTKTPTPEGTHRPFDEGEIDGDEDTPSAPAKTLVEYRVKGNVFTWDGQFQTVPRSPEHLHALRTKFFGAEKPTGSKRRADKAEFYRIRRVIADVVAAVENLPDSPDASLHFPQLSTRHHWQPAMRASRLSALQDAYTLLCDRTLRINNGGEQDTLSTMSEKELMAFDPKKRLLLELDIAGLIVTVQRRAIEYEICAIENFDLTHPAERLAELEHDLHTHGNTPGRLREIGSEIATLRAIAANKIEATSRRCVTGKFEDVRQAYYLLTTLTQYRVSQYELEAVVAEADAMQAALGQKWTRTELSARYNRLRKETHQLPVLTSPTPALLAWWGVPDIASA
jgi:hypothetical protein